MNKVVSFQDVSLNFGGVQALKNVSFDINENSLFAIIGPNGAGKTSLLNCINGIYKPTSGSISIFDNDSRDLHPDEIANLGVSRTFQNIELFEKACSLVDFIGCLPSRDKSPEKHLDIVFTQALKEKKPVEAHLDQCNIPSEKETELFCDFVEEYNYNGRCRAIHCVSLACHPLEYQRKIAKKLKTPDKNTLINTTDSADE